MLISDPSHLSGILGCHSLNSSRPGILKPERDFSWISSGRFQEVLKCHAEVFPVRKSLISDITGFPAGDRDHWLTFFTSVQRRPGLYHTDKKEIKFSSYIRKWSSCKVIYEEGLPNIWGNAQIFNHLHCKKELAVFPSPAGMSLIKLFLGGNNLVFSRPERVWSVTSRLGTGKWLTLFYSDTRRPL